MSGGWLDGKRNLDGPMGSPVKKADWMFAEMLRLRCGKKLASA